MSKPVKLQQQRLKHRRLDTQTDNITFGRSGSFTGRLFQDPAAMDGSWYNIASGTIYKPRQELINLKTFTRKDSILFTSLQIPRFTKILGAYIQLKHDSTVGAAWNASLPLDFAFYQERSKVSDQDNWKGHNTTKTSQEFVWRHVALNSRPRVNTLVTNGPNFYFIIREGALTNRGITSFANSGSTVIGVIQFGSNALDQETQTRGVFTRAYGNVVQIDSSSAACDRVLTRVQRAGTFDPPIPNVVCRIYDYNATTRTKGALRATSDPQAATDIGTTAGNIQTFLFPGLFSVTAGEYVLCTVEPETEWTHPGTSTGRLQGRYCSAMDNSTTGTNPVGSEEIIWWQPLNNGNASVYFFADERPVLYTGFSGTTVEDTPYQSAIQTGTLLTPFSGLGRHNKLYLNESMIRTLQDYNNENDLDGGLCIYIATAEPGSFGTVSLEWDAYPSSENGLFVAYRSTRTFIT